MRFALLIASPNYAQDERYWYLFLVLYGSSYLLDMLDGKAARTFD